MKENLKFNIILAVTTIIVALLIIPIAFNYLFLWESGESKGETSDWFTLYGNIFGGLTGGFFTYLALLLTIKHERKIKDEELMPVLDVPYQEIKLKNGDRKSLSIEIRNIGGSLAKNIECTLVLNNYQEVIDNIEKSRENLNISMSEFKAHRSEDTSIKVEGRLLNYKNTSESDESTHAPLGAAYSSYSPIFIGHCIPLKQDSSAKIDYPLDGALSFWIQSISEIFPENILLEKKLIFDFEMNLKYSSENYGEIKKTYKIEWLYKKRYWEQKTEDDYIIWNEFLLKSEQLPKKQ